MFGQRHFVIFGSFRGFHSLKLCLSLALKCRGTYLKNYCFGGILSDKSVFVSSVSGFFIKRESFQPSSSFGFSSFFNASLKSSVIPSVAFLNSLKPLPKVLAKSGKKESFLPSPFFGFSSSFKAPFRSSVAPSVAFFI